MTRIRVPLGKFIKEYSERNKGNEDIPVYSVTNSQGFCTEYFGKEVASQDKTTYKIVPQGYFAYNPSRINVGSVDWQRYEKRVIVSPLYNVFSVSEGIDRQYLYYFLRSDLGRQMIKAKASGSVRDNLKLDMLKEMTIPDISVEQQKFCSSVLDKLHKLIQMRQQELQKLDEFIKARFVELFGDPVSNSYGLPEATLPDLGEFGRGVSKHRPRNDIKLLGGKYPLIQTGDVANAGLYITSYSSTYSELGLKQSKMWDNEDLSNEFIVGGIIDKFFVQFELGWKVLKELLSYEGQSISATGSPKMILKTAYTIFDFIDEDIWLGMLKSRNDLTHIYDESSARRLVGVILKDYIPAFVKMQKGIEEYYGIELENI